MEDVLRALGKREKAFLLILVPGALNKCILPFHECRGEKKRPTLCFPYCTTLLFHSL
jgi:hypothetical protein